MESTSDLRKIYRKYDKENKGYIIQRDIYQIAKELGESMSEDQVHKLFKSIDKQGKGQINFEEFCVLMHNPYSLQ